MKILKSLKINFALIFIILSFLVQLNLSTNTKANVAIINELNSRYIFYRNLISKYGLNVSIEVVKTENEILLKSKQNQRKEQVIMGAEPKFFFTSCDFFPFIEIIVKAFTELSRENGTRIQDLYQYLLVYNILYFKYGNRRLAEEYYNRYIDISKLNYNSYVKFTKDDEVKNYLFSLPKHTVKSVLKFTKMEEELANNLKIDISSKKRVKNIYDFVINYVKENTSEEIENAMKTFITNYEEFVNIVSLINAKRFSFSESNYSSMINSLIENEYNSMKEIIYPNQFNRPTECKIIGPFLDLIDYILVKSKNEPKREILFSRLDEGIIAISMDNDVRVGETLTTSNNDRISSETHFLLTGKLPDFNIYDHLVSFLNINKSRWNLDRVNFCHAFGCGGFDIKSFYLNSEENIALIPFALNKEVANLDIIKVFKILNIKNPNHSLIPYFQSNFPLSYPIEIKSVTEFMNIINDGKVDDEKILNDFIKLKRIRRVFENNEFDYEVITNLVKENMNDYDFDFILSMFRLAFQKNSIINFNIMKSAELVEKNSLSDIKKIKKNYFS